MEGWRLTLNPKNWKNKILLLFAKENLRNLRKGVAMCKWTNKLNMFG